MRGIVALLLVFAAGQAAPEGYLTVLTDRPGLGIYLDGEFIGTSPIDNRPVAIGEHTVSLFHPDTIDNAYWQIRQYGIPTMILKLPALRRFDVGTKRVVVNSNEVLKVFLSSDRARRAPSQTCCLGAGCTTGIIGSSFLLGFLLAWLIHR